MAFACAVVFGAERTHWTFKPVTNPKPPKVHDKAWPLGDLDRFILNGSSRRGFALWQSQIVSLGGGG